MATQVEIARHLDLNDTSFRSLLERGIIPASERAKYDPDACRIAYIRHLRSIAAGRGSIVNDGCDLVTERARLAKEQADHFALKNGSMRNELLPRGETTLAITAIFKHIRDSLTTLPARLAGPLARMTETAEVRATLVRAIDDTLAELSETKVISIDEDQADAA